MIGSDLFGLFSGRKLFQKKRICLRTQQIKKKSFIKNSVKINDQFFLEIQKNLFLANFPNFGLGAKKISSKKLGCHAQLHKGLQHHAKIQRNLLI